MGEVVMCGEHDHVEREGVAEGVAYASVVLVPFEMGPGEFVLDTRFDGEKGVPDERLGYPYAERSEHLTRRIGMVIG